MTCIVGIVCKKSKKVFIAADSAGVAGYELTVRKDPKVFKNKDFIIGCTTSFRMIQLLRFSFTPPPVHDKDIYEYMCTDFINAVRKCFTDGGFLQKFTIGISSGDECGGTFLVGYKDRLFQVDSDFQVGESLNGMLSVGCGENYALGSLATSPDKLPAKDKLLKALDVASFFSAGVCKPFIVLNT